MEYQAKKRFVEVNGRLVHYRIAGQGPAVVLFHSSPQNGSFVLDPLLSLAKNFTLIALDTPGYGLSEPLSVEWPSAYDYAYAVTEVLNALGIGCCALYGTHTGAHIALEVALRDGERSKLLILDGISLNTVEEKRELLQKYAPNFQPDDGGGHLAKAWQHTRDQLLFYPWFQAKKERRLQADMADPQYIHEVVLAKMAAGDGYRKGYRAAFSHDTLSGLRQLRLPTVVVSREGDILANQVDRLSGADDCVRVVRLPKRHTSWLHGIEKELNSVQWSPSELTLIDQPKRSYYLEVNQSQRLIRTEGSGSSCPLLILHGEMETGASVKENQKMLAHSRSVIALDIAGTGFSEPLNKCSDLNDYYMDLLSILKKIGEDEYAVMAHGGSAALAFSLAFNRPQMVSAIILDNPIVPSLSEIDMLVSRIAPPFVPNSEGTHLLEAWHVLRDRQMFWPWYSRTKESIRMVDPSINPQNLQQQLVGILQAYRTYGDYVRATVSFEDSYPSTLFEGRALFIGDSNDRIDIYRRSASKRVSDGKNFERPKKIDPLIAAVSRFIDHP